MALGPVLLEGLNERTEIRHEPIGTVPNRLPNRHSPVPDERLRRGFRLSSTGEAAGGGEKCKTRRRIPCGQETPPTGRGRPRQNSAMSTTSASHTRRAQKKHAAHKNTKQITPRSNLQRNQGYIRSPEWVRGWPREKMRGSPAYRWPHLRP